MELRHLRYFVAVAEALSFRRAADKLRLAQPSLGRQIRDLEDEIGERLFDRDRRRVQLTDAGNVLLVDARRILESASAAIEAARDAGRGERGVLRIGTIGTLSASFLPASLADFQERYPKVEVEILEMSHAEQSVALLDGAIQVGFQPKNCAGEIDARLASRTVVTCDVVVVMPARHALAAERAISLPSLAEHTLLNYQPRNAGGYERWLRRLCTDDGGFTPRFRRPPIEHPSALFGMVAAGQGLLILPTLSLADAKKSPTWVTRPLRAPTPRFRLHAVWNPERPRPLLDNYLSLLSKRKSRRSA